MDFSGMDPKDARKAQRGWDLAAKHRIERAAPDLLAALEAIILSPHAVETKTYREARAAIARARGTSGEVAR